MALVSVELRSAGDRKPGDRPGLPADVLRVLQPIWSTKAETARRVRQRISVVMKWAIAMGYREDNPAGDAVTIALPRQKASVTNFAALPHAEVKAALERVRASGADEATKLMFELLVLTAVRSGDVRGARWSEIDLDAAVWDMPAERRKGERRLRVPLSPPAQEILAKARSLSVGDGLVFPNKTGKMYPT